MRTTTIVLTVLIMLVLLGVGAAGETPKAGWPHLRWKVGDCWMIRDWFARCYPPDYSKAEVDENSSSQDIRFAVKSVKPVQGHDAFEVEVSYPEREDKRLDLGRHFFYFRCDTGVLVRVSHLSARDATALAQLDPDKLHYDLPLDPAGPDIGDPAVTHPYWLPIWSRGDIEVKLPAEWGVVTGQQFVQDQGTGWLTCKIERAQVSHGEHLLNEDNEIIQKWAPGEPWWRQMDWYRGGQHVGHAELLPETVNAPDLTPKHNPKGLPIKW